MKYIDLTFPTPHHNLACDEALIQWCEDRCEDEILRFWEPRQYFAVLGHSGKIQAEVDLISCRANRIPVLRRCSGGGTVLQGPGCLNYSLILRIRNRSSLQGVTEANQFIMRRLKSVLEAIMDSEIEIQGISDLAIEKRKFSGNAQYRKRRFLLFHGTFLLHFDFSMIEKLLPVPSKQPAYRQNRSHGNFLTNLNLPPHRVKEALKQSWSAREEFKNIPFEAIESLVGERYSRDEWNFKF